MSEDKTNQVEKVQIRKQTSASSYTRLAAVVVLVAAVPMMILSSLALILFYITPTRFESLLARLPGEAAIRTVLIFAPVTLLAIIVLAVLYALEKPVFEVTRPQIVRPTAVKREPVTQFGRINIQRIAWWVLLISFAALLFIVPVRAAAFLSPTRFENFLGRFPAQGVTDFIVHSGPVILLVVEFLAGVLFVGTRNKLKGGIREVLFPGMKWLRKTGPIHLSVGIVLSFSLPILLISLTSFVMFFARTERFLSMIDHLPSEVPLRMGLIFIPASSIIVVALAVLFLIKGRSGIETPQGELLTPSASGILSRDAFFWYLSWILAWAIALAGAAIIGSVVGLVVLIFK